jgi:hypothetical protein
MSAAQPAPAKVSVDLPIEDNRAFTLAVMAQLGCLGLIARHLTIAHKLVPEAERFASSPPVDPNDISTALAWLSPGSPWMRWVDLVDSFDNSLYLLFFGQLFAVGLFVYFIARMEYWFADAGRPRGFTKLPAFWFIVTASVAWLILGVAWSVGFGGDEPKVADVQDFVHHLNVNMGICLGLTAVSALCLYWIRRVVTFLPFDTSPTPVGVVEVGSQLPALPDV